MKTIIAMLVSLAANEAPAMAQTVAGADGGSDGDGQPGSDSYQAWAG